MDTGEGRFVEVDPEDLPGMERLGKQYPNRGALFSVGEIVEIKGSRFEVSKIIQNGLKLRLLPKGE